MGVPIVAVVGFTASGKTELSLDLAQRLGGEIVNTDAMQIYCGMDIGTAKISTTERDGVPHHLLDILDVTETATVAEFQQLARQAIDDCIDRGKVPVLAGGSALYIRAILDDFVFPGTDATVRARLEAELAAKGSGALHQRLAEGRTASRAIGYREVMAHLRGELSLDEARERTVIATRQFARRQDSWFRKDPRIHWIAWDDPGRAELAEAMVRKIGQAGPP